MMMPRMTGRGKQSGRRAMCAHPSWTWGNGYRVGSWQHDRCHEPQIRVYITAENYVIGKQWREFWTPSLLKSTNLGKWVASILVHGRNTGRAKEESQVLIRSKRQRRGPVKWGWRWVATSEQGPSERRGRLGRADAEQHHSTETERESRVSFSIF